MYEHMRPIRLRVLVLFKGLGDGMLFGRKHGDSCMWAKARHAGVIANLEADCFPDSWPLAKVRKHLAAKDHEGIVIIRTPTKAVPEPCTGYVLHRWLDPGRIVIDRLGVPTRYRRHGIGRKLMDAIVAVATAADITLIAPVDEQSLVGQKFLRACGFRCVRIVDGECIFERRPAGQANPDFGPIDLGELHATNCVEM